MLYKHLFARREGIVALLTTILIALFLFSLGVLLGVQGNTSIVTGQLANQSDKAEALAQAGIQDASIKIGRDQSYTGTYSLTETDGTVAVTVIAGAPVVVNATGTVTVGKEIVQRGIQAQITLDADGKITNITETDQ